MRLPASVLVSFVLTAEECGRGESPIQGLELLWWTSSQGVALG